MLVNGIFSYREICYYSQLTFRDFKTYKTIFKKFTNKNQKKLYY